MRPMTIRYVKWLPIAALIAGGLNLALAVLTEGQVLSMVAGGVLMLLGVLMFVNPIARIESDQIRLLNALGMTVRKFPVSSPADVRVDGKVLRHVPSGDKKILSLGFAVDQGDADAVKAAAGATSA